MAETKQKPEQGLETGEEQTPLAVSQGQIRKRRTAADPAAQAADDGAGHGHDARANDGQ
jgi:hypothetical protein